MRILIAVLLCSLAANAQERKLVKADIDRWMKELSNWGRWGKDDQLGALNLITAAKRKEALKLAVEGYPVSLAHDVETERAADNSNPFDHKLTLVGPWAVESISVSYHGYAHTHMDSLCHMFYEGKMYNGFAQSEVTKEGAGKLAILNAKQGIMTRGILMDMARLKGVEYLEPGTPIYPEDLSAWEKQAGVKVSAGDVVFIRTGRWARRAAKGPWDGARNAAGLHASCAKWLKDRDVAMVGSDMASDLSPSQVEGVSSPIHQLLLIAMGVHIFDNCDLEAVAKAAAERKRWAFLLTAAPMAVRGGTGSPLNPIATF